MASTQKMMLYMLPFIYVITGPGMPIGVLIYWLTTNVWTFVQQYIVIRATPTPGSAAEKQRHERINAKRAKKGLEPLDFTPKKSAVEIEQEAASAPIRVQPVGKKRSTGKKLTDEEKLERAREARARAREERRAKLEADGKLPDSSASTGSALRPKGGTKSKGSKRRR